MKLSKNTQIFGVTPEELKESIIKDVREELSKIKLNTEPQPQEEYLTRKELAKLFKVTLPTISDWSNKGILKPYRLGNLVRFKRSDINKALKTINPKKQ